MKEFSYVSGNPKTRPQHNDILMPMNWLRNDDRKPWVLPQLNNDEINRIHTYNNSKAFFDIVIRLGVHATLIYLGIIFIAEQQYVIVLGLILINGFLWNFMGWAGVGHELFHRSVFSNKKLNDYLCKILAALNWNNYEYFRNSHSLHHQNTMYDNDPEAPLPKGLRKGEILPLIFINPIYVIRRVKIVILNSIGVIPGEFGKFLSKNETKRKRIRNFARFIIFAQLSLIVVFIISGNWILILLINLAPFIAKFPNRILEIVQHLKMQNRVNDFRLNTRSVEVHSIIKFFYCNMNYHLEHHLFPTLPYYNMNLARKKLIENKFIEEIKIKGFRQILRTIYEK